MSTIAQGKISRWEEVGMTADQLQGGGQHAPIRTREAQEFRVMYLAAFPLFLVAEVVTRCICWRGGSIGRKSVFAEAKAAANTCLPFAFMR